MSSTEAILSPTTANGVRILRRKRLRSGQGEAGIMQAVKERNCEAKMNRRVQCTLMIVAAFTLPTLARAGNTEMTNKRAALLKPERRAELFRAMDSVYPYHVIKRGGSVSKLLRAPRRLDVTYTFAGQRHSLDDLLTRSRTQGFLVIKDGKVVDERYFNGANDKSKFTSFSVAKSFTSTLVGLALADGKIKTIDDPVTNYLPELKGSGYDGVPVRDLLEMSSGVKFSEEYNKSESDVMVMWRKTMDEESETLADYAKSLGRAEAPGTKFVYRSIDTGVLGMLIRRVTGERLADLLSERIWQPLGMESDATWLTDRSGPSALEAAYCCINATLRDYGRFGLLFLNRGREGERQVVPASWVEQATTPQSSAVQYGRLFPGTPSGYGYQWWLIQPGLGQPYSAMGVFFQFIYVMPKYKMVIVKASAYDDFWSDWLMIEQITAFDAIGRALSVN
jgi:CubicO group peptidase (beta-lactamase class C family)